MFCKRCGFDGDQEKYERERLLMRKQWEKRMRQKELNGEPPDFYDDEYADYYDDDSNIGRCPECGRK